MGRYSSNAALKESPESVFEGQNKPYDKNVAARQALTEMPTKDVASALRVNERTVTKWRNGESQIPQAQEMPIIQARLNWGLDRQMLTAKCARIISEEMAKIYGPRNGHASREVF